MTRRHLLLLLILPFLPKELRLKYQRQIHPKPVYFKKTGLDALMKTFRFTPPESFPPPRLQSKIRGLSKIQWFKYEEMPMNTTKMQIPRPRILRKRPIRQNGAYVCC